LKIDNARFYKQIKETHSLSILSSTIPELQAYFVTVKASLLKTRIKAILPRIINADQVRETIRLDAEAALELEMQQQRDLEFALLQGPRRSERATRAAVVNYADMGGRDRRDRSTRDSARDSYTTEQSNGIKLVVN
jgi:hypothetical protein